VVSGSGRLSVAEGVAIVLVHCGGFFMSILAGIFFAIWYWGASGNFIFFSRAAGASSALTLTVRGSGAMSVKGGEFGGFPGPFAYIPSCTCPELKTFFFPARDVFFRIVLSCSYSAD
jgi:hypothetical protein